jgi:hypothetical protein
MALNDTLNPVFGKIFQKEINQSKNSLPFSRICQQKNVRFISGQVCLA